MFNLVSINKFQRSRLTFDLSAKVAHIGVIICANLVGLLIGLRTVATITGRVHIIFTVVTWPLSSEVGSYIKKVAALPQ